MRYASFLLTFTCCLSWTTSFSQDKNVKKVLDLAVVGKAYHFHLAPGKEINEAYITYLGSINANTGKVYKVVSWKFVWGPNQHTSGTVYLFGGDKSYVGKYRLGDGLDLPSSVKGSYLIFDNALKTGCDPKLVSRISFRSGPPKEIFLKCKDQHGDLYHFSTEK